MRAHTFAPCGQEPAREARNRLCRERDTYESPGARTWCVDNFPPRGTKIGGVSCTTMELFGSSKPAASSAETKDALKQRVAAEVAMANAQQLISKATEKCYLKCVPSPGTSFTGKEQTCTERCLERYFEAFNIVSSTYVRRVAAERQAGALATDSIA